MTLYQLSKKKVGILGYGQEGQALTRFFLSKGLKPEILDNKPKALLPKQALNFLARHKLRTNFGPKALNRLYKLDVNFRSPGIPFLQPQLVRARKRGLIVSSQTQWFFEHCRAKIIGVTGTKGKGTTASLIYKMIKEEITNHKSQIKNVYLTGNIGQMQPLEILDKLQPNDWVVYELSSFQLQDLRRSPHIAVVLMVTSEHLDYHRTTAEYRQAKSAIARFQKAADSALINSDYAASKKIGSLGIGKKIYFSRKRAFGQACFIQNGYVCLKANNGGVSKLIKTDSVKLLGRHNLENVCAAALAASCAGASLTAIRQTLKNFRGLPHRLEALGERGGISFYDDSYSTAPEAAAAAISALSSNAANTPAGKIIPILGGSKKQSDFSRLITTIKRTKNLNALILIGQSAPILKKALLQKPKFKGKILLGAKTMKRVFKQIKQIARPGDTVVLTPGCASFDMFANCKSRGEQFKAQFKLI